MEKEVEVLDKMDKAGAEFATDSRGPSGPKDTKKPEIIKGMGLGVGDQTIWDGQRWRIESIGNKAVVLTLLGGGSVVKPKRKRKPRQR